MEARCTPSDMVIVVLAMVFAASTSLAGLIAHYDFADGNLIDDTQGNYDLTAYGTSPPVTLDPLGFAAFPGDPSAYLEAIPALTDVADFTVSLWWRAETIDQGDFKGIFVNDTNSNNDGSFQFDNHNGAMRWRAKENGSDTQRTIGEISGLSQGTWYHTVLREDSDGAGGSPRLEFYVTDGAAAAVNLVGSENQDTGGFPVFRLGVNRNANNGYPLDMGTVKIYDDSTVNLDSLLAEGPGVIPEPGAFSLLMVGCLSLLTVRSRGRR